MSSQLCLFQTESSALPDGSFVVRPRRLVDGREIGIKKACEMLGFRDREAVYRLIRCGEIRAWRPAALRDNGKYRIDLGSVLDYKTRRLAEA